MGRRGCLFSEVRDEVVADGELSVTPGGSLTWMDPRRYNIAPRTFAPVIRKERDRGTYTMHTMKFGLVPSWFKHEDNKLSTFNARAEGLLETGGLWDSMKKQKRCIVAAQGFVV